MENVMNKLRKIVENNFQIDEENLLQDLHKQFPEKGMFIRELAANSFDAGASHFFVSGSEEDGLITIEASDNGNGMADLRDYFTVFKSLKEGIPNLIGTFGVGKVSMLAVNPTRFELNTSTGKISWQAKSGALLKRERIEVTEISPALPKGTSIKLTYKPEGSLTSELEKLKTILTNSVAFLPMEIIVSIPHEYENRLEHFPYLINEAWPGNNIQFHKSYNEKINGSEYEICIGIGKTVHALYQNKVFICDKYNLLQPDSDISVSKLCIMIDSGGFVLPMGRHAIINIDVLELLAEKIQHHLINFYQHLFMLFQRGNLPMSNYEFMVLTSQLIFHFNIPTRPWLSMPVFTGMEQILYSFNDIETLVERGKSIYIASPKTEGLDFSDFNKNGIVLSNEQHGKCPELVKKYFQDAVVDLTAKDLIMEELTPESTKVVLSQKEKKFQQHLGFHRNFKIPKKSKANVFEEEHVNSWDMLDRQYKSSTEINYQAANMELESLNWRISRLVQRDGKTQCTSHLFMLKDYTIVLNLHHPKIAQLVALSDINVQLSAHFAMALALETQSILPHIESEQRQNLLLTDAMSRISENNWSDENELSQPNNMLRDLNDDIN